MRQRHTRGTKQMAAAMAAIQTKTARLRRCERKKGSKLGEFVRNFSHYVRLAVSPEFRLRPLLSEGPGHRAHRRRLRVSPEFRLRPLLSAASASETIPVAA